MFVAAVWDFGSRTLAKAAEAELAAPAEAVQTRALVIAAPAKNNILRRRFFYNSCVLSAVGTKKLLYF
jgi:hypothetical protein